MICRSLNRNCSLVTEADATATVFGCGLPSTRTGARCQALKTSDPTIVSAMIASNVTLFILRVEHRHSREVSLFTNLYICRSAFYRPFDSCTDCGIEVLEITDRKEFLKCGSFYHSCAPSYPESLLQ